MATTIEIVDRRWAKPDDPADTTRHVVYCDPAKPGARYETAPCANTTTAEQQAIQAHINARKAAKLDYAGQPPPVSTDTVSVSV